MRYLILLFFICLPQVSLADCGGETCGATNPVFVDTTNEQTCRISDEGEPHNLSEFVGAFQQLGTSWKGVLNSYRDIINSAEGKQLTNDVYTNDLMEGLDIIRGLVQEKLDQARETNQEMCIWYFDKVPFKEFGRTLDDVYIAFLRWASVEPNQFHECGLKGGINKSGPINVSKAFRRLEQYAQWMDSTGDDLVDLTAESVKATAALLFFRVTIDSCDRVVWWLDLGQTNFSALKELPDTSILRLFVWLAHLIMFEEKAQENGVVFFESMAYVGFWQYMTMLPMSVGLMLDKYMVGVIPVRTKLVVFLKRPLWVEIMYGILAVFLPKRMKRRVDMPRNNDQNAIEETVGVDCIPVDFDDLNGTIKVDLMAERLQKVSNDS
jgi:hypothetical protein